MNFKILAICFFNLISMSLMAQYSKPADTEAEYNKGYKWRVRQEVLYGVYIPKDLGEAFNELNRKISKENQAKFKSLTEEQAVSKLFFSFGRWMILNWQFYEGSRFGAYLKTAGIHHPEDQARFVIKAYHRYLNKKPLDIKGLAEGIKAKVKKQQADKVKKGEVLHEETVKKKGGN